MCYFKFGKISFYISDVVMKIFYQSNILSKRPWYSLVLYDMSWERIFKNNIHQKKIYEIKMNLMLVVRAKVRCEH